MKDYDYVIVGGGLQAGLLATAVRKLQPESRVILFERDAKLGGNHTWSFHEDDLPQSAACFVEPMIAVRWPAYDVRFPGYSRTVPSAYSTITTERFSKAILDSGCEVRTSTEVASVAKRTVTTTDGAEYVGRCVIEARGGATNSATPGCGYQKFVGWEIESERPLADARPMLMDASVPQDDGFRFLYTLPLSPHRMLVEDTYFSDDAELSKPLLRERLIESIERRGIGRHRVVREESGVLPMPWIGCDLCVDPETALVAGAAGGWFHPATGYSFPLAVRLSSAVARVAPEDAHRAAAGLAACVSKRMRFARLLNRLLFTMVTPSERHQVFRRLYRSVPDATLRRFYALEFNRLDAVRMIVGRPPPISLSRLFRSRRAIHAPR